ncbi:MAG: hypothetical protein HY819_11660 [Acidobacteria bacterium]|nr:hypothetical protein [Acidobacteriota bacterium]
MRNKLLMLGVILLGIFSASYSFSFDRKDITKKTTNLLQNCSEGFQSPEIRANLEDKDINESSGVVASRLNPGVYWTHNDSGDGPFIYAFDLAGKKKGVWKVKGAQALDWEDIAIGPGPKPGKSYLYTGDIGDNLRLRAELTIYQFLEPKVSQEDANVLKSNAKSTKKANIIRLKYPDGVYDAEALLIHPKSGDLYIITKPLRPSTGEVARVYKASAPLSTNSAITMTFITTLALPLQDTDQKKINGADISPNGQQVALSDYDRGYEICLPSGETNFDNIWKQPLQPLELNVRRQGESICYRLDGNALLTTSEGVNQPLAEILRKGIAK